MGVYEIQFLSCLAILVCFSIVRSFWWSTQQPVEEDQAVDGADGNRRGCLLYTAVGSNLDGLVERLSYALPLLHKHYPNPYSVFVAHLALSSAQQAAIAQLYEGTGGVRFVNVSRQWRRPAFMTDELGKWQPRTCGNYDENYRLAQRFFAFSLFQTPEIVDQCAFVQRMDTDLFFMRQFPPAFDFIRELAASNAVMGFLRDGPDSPACNRGLQEYVQAFHKQLLDGGSGDMNHTFLYSLLEPARSSAEAQASIMATDAPVGPKLYPAAGDPDFSALSRDRLAPLAKQVPPFWSITAYFQVFRMSFFTSPVYLALGEYLDRTGGFFRFRYTDGDVHLLAMAALLGAQPLRETGLCFGLFDDFVMHVKELSHVQYCLDNHIYASRPITTYRSSLFDNYAGRLKDDSAKA